MGTILILTGDHEQADPTKWDGAYSADDLELHDAMVEAFRSLKGRTFDVLTRHAELLDRLRDDPPAFVVNFCDTGYDNRATQELHVPALLEVFGVPYTGSGPQAMVLCYDKALVRLLAQDLGVPVPHEVVIGPDDPIPALTFPSLIKPARGDGSVGINTNAVVHSQEEAERQLTWFRENLPGEPALVQEYLPGPEYGLALIGNPGHGFRALPPLEVDFSALPDHLPKILAFESKTGPNTDYGRVKVRRAELDADVIAELRTRAERLFARLGCRDYARFDFRTGADGAIKLMEVNPNPAWSHAAKLALMARFDGLEYRDLLELILTTAERRAR